jgi:hypothetical protein
MKKTYRLFLGALILFTLNLKVILAQEVPAYNPFLFAGNGFYDPDERRIIHVDHTMDLTLYQNSGGFFWAKNLSGKEATIAIDFDRFTGVQAFESLPYIKLMPPGNQRLFNLNLAAGTGIPDIHFSFYYTYEAVNPKLTDISYILPVKNDKKVRVERAALYLTDAYDDGLMKFFGIRFKLDKGDEILAARRGVVEKVIISAEKEFERANRIKIRHFDGSISDYIGFDGESITVKEGDDVFTGMPLAVAGGSDDENSSDLFFSTSYLKIDAKKKFDDWASILFIEPLFQTKNYKGALEDDKVYVSLINQELVNQEVSKTDSNLGSVSKSN